MRKGFTLTELLITAVLIGLVGLSVAAISGAAQSYLSKTTGMGSAQAEASYAMWHIKRNLSRANRVIVWSSTQISFRYDGRNVLAGTATPMDSTDDGWDYYGWDSQSGTLVYKRRVIPDGPNAGTDPSASPGTQGGEAIARNVTACTWTQVSPVQFDIAIAVRKSVGPQSQTSRFSSTVSPRGISITLSGLNSTSANSVSAQ